MLISMAAPLVVHAQTDDGDSDPDDDSSSAELAQAIGCVATYDTILAGSHGQAAPAIRKARDAALDVFREDSDLPDAQVMADVAQADQMLPTILKDSHLTLSDYKATCDAAFMADPFADQTATVL